MEITVFDRVVVVLAMAIPLLGISLLALWVFVIKDDGLWEALMILGAVIVEAVLLIKHGRLRGYES